MRGELPEVLSDHLPQGGRQGHGEEVLPAPDQDLQRPGRGAVQDGVRDGLYNQGATRSFKHVCLSFLVSIGRVTGPQENLLETQNVISFLWRSVAEAVWCSRASRSVMTSR